MDTLTHALSGALAARATAPKGMPPRSIPRRVAAGFFAAAAPDLDFVIGFLGPAEYLLHHRGVTHSVIMLPLWAWVLAWALARILREPGGWRALYGVCALALGVHIVGDIITSFGTIVFAPLSTWRAGIGTTFIIDLWFSGIILGGLFASAILYRSRVPAIAASVALAGYVGMQWLQKQEALAFGERYAASRGLSGAKIDALPRPVSPFNWTVFVSDDEVHHFAHINLVRDAPRPYQPGDGFVARLDAPYLPVARAQWARHSRYGETPEARALAREAFESAPLGFFRWFAALPAFDGITEGSTCAWFMDLRFQSPGRDTVPFRFGACRDAPGAPWRGYERDGETGRIPLD